MHRKSLSLLGTLLARYPDVPDAHGGNDMDFPKFLLVATLLASLPVLANAESQFTTGSSGALLASGKLDFQIEIPKVLFLRVGAGADRTTNASVDLIAFNLAAAIVGDGSAVAASVASGDLGADVDKVHRVGSRGSCHRF